MGAKVTVKCVQCEATKQVGLGQDQPMCDTCFMPMIAVSAKVKIN